ncbi:unnamed protein product [Heligmosomoides polygyrus]|uniref:Secreted protein n=1 Tax=Heligmosomoides polygyrus TaxID=6339 RepID=A0A183G5P2_HELPZ|nr:unnamed protein product [Heligmosomoides polygyrus]
MMKDVIELLLLHLLSGKGSAAAMDTLCCGGFDGGFAAAAGNVDRHFLLRLLFAILIIIRIICESSLHPHLLLEPGLLRHRSVLEALGTSRLGVDHLVVEPYRTFYLV